MSDKKFSNSKEFETFVLAVIRQIAAKNKQIIRTGNSTILDCNYEYQYCDNNHYYYDAIAPDGFGDIKQPVIFDIRYHIKGKLHLNEADIVSRISRNKDACFIIITNLVLDEEWHNTITAFYDDFWYSRGFRIVVWDKSVIDHWITDFPIDYNNSITIRELNKTSIPLRVNDEDFTIKSNNNTAVLKGIIDRNETFALVLGAGVSIDLGAKSWDKLLDYFKRRLLKKKVLLKPSDVCKRIGDTLLITAGLYKELYNSDKDFYWDIHKGLYLNNRSPGKRTEIDAVIGLIEKCRNGCNFRILTYNYDEFLEKSLDKAGIPYTVIFNQNCTPSTRLSVYHAHGFLPRVKSKNDMQEQHYRSIVLTESNYNDLYNHPYDWTIACQLSFFRENTCLFVGSSLSDPNIRRLLQITKSDKVHYAIMAKHRTTVKDLTILSNHFLKLGVEIIWVNDYSDIVDLLDYLAR